MADESLPPIEPRGNLPKGGRGVKKGSESKGNSRQTLFLKRRGTPEERASYEGASSIPVREKMAPIEKSQHPKSDAKAVDDNWGSAPSGQLGTRMVLWALALVVPVLAIITAFVLINQDPPAAASEGQLNFNFNLSAEDEFDLSGPRAWFEENPHVHYVGAIDILDRLNQAEGGKVPESVFRREHFALGEIADHGMGWDSELGNGLPVTP